MTGLGTLRKTTRHQKMIRARVVMPTDRVYKYTCLPRGRIEVPPYLRNSLDRAKLKSASGFSKDGIEDDCCVGGFPQTVRPPSKFIFMDHRAYPQEWDTTVT